MEVLKSIIIPNIAALRRRGAIAIPGYRKKVGSSYTADRETFWSGIHTKGTRKDKSREDPSLESLFKVIDESTGIESSMSTPVGTHRSILLPQLCLEDFLHDPAVVLQQVHLQCIPQSFPRLL